MRGALRSFAARFFFRDSHCAGIGVAGVPDICNLLRVGGWPDSTCMEWWQVRLRCGIFAGMPCPRGGRMRRCNRTLLQDSAGSMALLRNFPGIGNGARRADDPVRFGIRVLKGVNWSRRQPSITIIVITVDGGSHFFLFGICADDSGRRRT